MMCDINMTDAKYVACMEFAQQQDTNVAIVGVFSIAIIGIFVWLIAV